MRLLIPQQHFSQQVKLLFFICSSFVLIIAAHIVHAFSIYEQGYESNIITFLEMYPNEILQDQNLVEILMEQYQQNPSQFDYMFLSINKEEEENEAKQEKEEENIGKDIVTTTESLVENIHNLISDNTNNSNNDDNNNEDNKETSTTTPLQIEDLVDLGFDLLNETGILSHIEEGLDSTTTTVDTITSTLHGATNNNNKNNDPNGNGGSSNSMESFYNMGLNLLDETGLSSFLEEQLGTTIPSSSSSRDDGLVLDANQIMDEINNLFGGGSNNKNINIHDIAPTVGSCVFCDTKNIDNNKTFAGMKCEDWSLYSPFALEDECNILRAAAVESCGCTPPKTITTTNHDICTLCPDGTTTNIKYNLSLPTMSDELLCRDILHIPAVEGQKTCQAVQSFAYFCGCTNTNPPCSVCRTNGGYLSQPYKIIGGFSNEILLKKTQANSISTARTNNNLSTLGQHHHDMTCADFDHWLSDHTQSSCPKDIADMESRWGISLPAYCGCTNTPIPELCDPCPPGFVLNNDDSVSEIAVNDLGMTCQTWANEWAPFVVEPSVCLTLQAKAESDCCHAAEPELLHAQLSSFASSPSRSALTLYTITFTLLTVFGVTIL